MSIVTSEFAGAKYPPGTKVSFVDQGGHVARHRTKIVAPASTGSNAARNTVERAVQRLDG